jgi:hypothetical protein
LFETKLNIINFIINDLRLTVHALNLKWITNC